MTPAQAAWLRKLRDEGPQACRLGAGSTGSSCRKRGWSKWRPDAHEARDFTETITPAGLAALAAHENGEKE